MAGGRLWVVATQTMIRFIPVADDLHYGHNVFAIVGQCPFVFITQLQCVKNNRPDFSL